MILIIMKYYYLLECNSNDDCTKANKNICTANMCECNTGSVPDQDMCKACESNQIVENGACKDCSPGMNPTLDRLVCMECEDDEISPDGNMCMMCTIPGYVPNTDQTDCVGMLNCVRY